MRDLLFWALGFVFGGLLVYYRTERQREDTAAGMAELKRLLGGVQTHVEREPWPLPQHPREFDDMTQPVLRMARYTPPPPPIDWYRNEHQRLSWGWWVEQAQRLATRLAGAAEPVMESDDIDWVGRHRPESVDIKRAIGRAKVDGDTTQEFKRITAGYYSAAAAHVVAAREVAR